MHMKYLSICLLLFGIFILSTDCQELINNIQKIINCNFEKDYCNWNNVAIPPENKQRWKLFPLKNKERDERIFTKETYVLKQIKDITNNTIKNFIFTNYFNKTTQTTLISDYIQSHDTPISIYFKSVFIGNPKLIICQKQILNNQSTLFNNCKHFLSKNNTIHDNSYELLSTKFTTQIVIRAFCLNENDSIALSSIYAKKRFKRNEKTINNNHNVQVITFDEWQKMKDTTKQFSTVNIKPSVVLVVAKNVENSSEIPENESSESSNELKSALDNSKTSTTLTTTTSTTTSTALITSSSACNESFCVEEDSKEFKEKEKNEIENSEDESVHKLFSPPQKHEDPKQAMENLAQWVQILRNLAPVLPIIPSLINSFKTAGNSPTSTASGGSYVDPTMSTGEQIFNWKNSVGNNHLIPVSTMSSIIQRSPQHINNNYEAPMNNNLKSIERLNLSKLTINELKILESIHKKIFPINNQNQNQHDELHEKVKNNIYGTSKMKNYNRINNNNDDINNKKKMTSSFKKLEITTQNTPMIIYNKPKQLTNPTINSDFSKAYRYLTPEMIREIDMLASLPNFDELIEGLDVSLLNKPGGFAILKKQVFERLLTRLPLNNEDSDLLLSGK